MNIFVVIVTYNGSQWLHRCIGSLFESSVAVQVVVVDNNSTDDSLKIVSEFPQVSVLASAENLGFGKANNAGMRHALDQGADYVFLLNQDAWLRPNTIEHLVQASLNNPEYYILSPLHLEGSERKLDLNFQHYISPENCKDLLSDLAVSHTKPVDKYNPLEKIRIPLQEKGSHLADLQSPPQEKHIELAEVYETRFVNAALWLLPRQCLIEIGGFDPMFAHYGEDNDFAKRVKYHGYKSGVCPGIFGVHDRPQRNDFSEAGRRRPKSQQKLETEALIKLKNVNSGLTGIALRVYLKMFKSILLSGLRLQFSELGKHVVVLVNTTGKLQNVRKHRAISQKRGASAVWLRERPTINTIKLPDYSLPGELQ